MKKLVFCIVTPIMVGFLLSSLLMPFLPRMYFSPEQQYLFSRGILMHYGVWTHIIPLYIKIILFFSIPCLFGFIGILRYTNR
jgi:hypothetical protein